MSPLTCRMGIHCIATTPPEKECLILSESHVKFGWRDLFVWGGWEAEGVGGGTDAGGLAVRGQGVVGATSWGVHC